MEGQCGTGVTLSAGERRALGMMGKEGRRGEDARMGRSIALNSYCRVKSHEGSAELGFIKGHLCL